MDNIETQNAIKQSMFDLRTLAQVDDDALDLFGKVQEKVPMIMVDYKNLPSEALKTFNVLVKESRLDEECKNNLYIAEIE